MADPKSVTDNPTFISMMAAALAEEDVRRTLLRLLELEPARRTAALDIFLADMTAKGAPAPFVEAVAYLKDDGVAEEALRVLRGKGE